MNSTDKLTCFFMEVYWTKTVHDVTVSVISCLLSSIFALSAVFGNGIVMLVIWKKRELHSPSFALLFFLASSDFLVGFVGQPSFVAYKVAESLKKFNAYCNLRMIEFFCGWITSSVSFVILGAASVDRLLALTLHLRYKSTVTVCRITIAMIAVWVFCCIVTILKFWVRNWVIIPVSFVVVNIFSSTFCTWKIYQIARRHQSQINSQIKKIADLRNVRNRSQNNPVDAFKCKKSATTVIYLYGIMLMFYLPFIAVSAVEAIQGYTWSIKIAYDYATTIVFINSSVNPFIYCWRNTQVRRAIKNYLRKLSFRDNSGTAEGTVHSN